MLLHYHELLQVASLLLLGIMSIATGHFCTVDTVLPSLLRCEQLYLGAEARATRHAAALGQLRQRLADF